MEQAKQGDTVKVHYKGTLEDGTVFDSSLERDPLVFTLGAGRVISGFDEAVRGMHEGESKAARVPAEKAYGQHRDDMVLDVSREDIPADIELQPGQQLQLQQENAQPVPVMVTDVSDEAVTLDANHPLAGKNLMFELELLEIV
jgi:FKBP-type peptidyl-prolyl cis-trans isomerase 2